MFSLRTKSILIASKNDSLGHMDYFNDVFLTTLL